MDEQRKKRIDRNMMILSFGVLLAAIAFAVYQGITKQDNARLFDIILIAALIIFWVLMDIVRPRLTGELIGIREEEKKKYYMLSLLDLGGYAGLAYFVIARQSQTGFYGALVFVLTTIGKRRIRESGQEEAQEEAQEDIEAAGQIPENTDEPADTETVSEEMPEQDKDNGSI